MLKDSLLWTLCLLLAPLLLVQGWMTRRSALKLPVATGPKGGGSGDYSLLVIGDSVVAGVGVQHSEEALPARLAAELGEIQPGGFTWRAIGQNGDRIRDVLRRLPLVEAPLDLVIVNIGVNDVSHLTSILRWQLALTTIVSEVTRRFRAPIVFLGLPPMQDFPVLPQPLRFALGVRANMLDCRIERMAEIVPQVTYVPTKLPLQLGDMADDGYHPSATIIGVWSKQIAATLHKTGVIPLTGRTKPSS